jgi:hypothetical protein
MATAHTIKAPVRYGKIDLEKQRRWRSELRIELERQRKVSECAFRDAILFLGREYGIEEEAKLYVAYRMGGIAEFKKFARQRRASGQSSDEGDNESASRRRREGAR